MGQYDRVYIRDRSKLMGYRGRDPLKKGGEDFISEEIRGRRFFSSKKPSYPVNFLRSLIPPVFQILTSVE